MFTIAKVDMAVTLAIIGGVVFVGFEGYKLLEKLISDVQTVGSAAGRAIGNVGKGFVQGYDKWVTTPTRHLLGIQTPDELMIKQYGGDIHEISQFLETGEMTTELFNSISEDQRNERVNYMWHLDQVARDDEKDRVQKFWEHLPEKQQQQHSALLEQHATFEAHAKKEYRMMLRHQAEADSEEYQEAVKPVVEHASTSRHPTSGTKDLDAFLMVHQDPNVDNRPPRSNVVINTGGPL